MRRRVSSGMRYAPNVERAQGAKRTYFRSPFRANVCIAESAVRPLRVFGDMLMLERQWKTLKLRPWGEARYKTRLGNKERLCPKKTR